MHRGNYILDIVVSLVCNVIHLLRHNHPSAIKLVSTLSIRTCYVLFLYVVALNTKSENGTQMRCVGLIQKV